jgi:hypothetical protein
MGFFNNLFGKSHNGSKGNRRMDHSVVISFNYCFKDLGPLQDLEDMLRKTIDEKNLGEYEGSEIEDDLSCGNLYMYGPNAEDLFKGIKFILDQTEFMKGAKAKLIFGEMNQNGRT